MRLTNIVRSPLWRPVQLSRARSQQRTDDRRGQQGSGRGLVHFVLPLADILADCRPVGRDLPSPAIFVATKFKRDLAGRWKPPAGRGADFGRWHGCGRTARCDPTHDRSLLTDDSGRLCPLTDLPQGLRSTRGGCTSVVILGHSRGSMLTECLAYRLAGGCGRS